MSSFDAREFRYRMALARTSQMAIYRWSRGLTIPRPDKMDTLVKTLKGMGIKSAPETLFPSTNIPE